MEMMHTNTKHMHTNALTLRTSMHTRTYTRILLSLSIYLSLSLCLSLSVSLSLFLTHSRTHTHTYTHVTPSWLTAVPTLTHKKRTAGPRFTFALFMGLLSAWIFCSRWRQMQLCLTAMAGRRRGWRCIEDMRRCVCVCVYIYTYLPYHLTTYLTTYLTN